MPPSLSRCSSNGPAEGRGVQQRRRAERRTRTASCAETSTCSPARGAPPLGAASCVATAANAAVRVSGRLVGSRSWRRSRCRSASTGGQSLRSHMKVSPGAAVPRRRDAGGQGPNPRRPRRRLTQHRHDHQERAVSRDSEGLLRQSPWEAVQTTRSYARRAPTLRATCATSTSSTTPRRPTCRKKNRRTSSSRRPAHPTRAASARGSRRLAAPSRRQPRDLRAAWRRTVPPMPREMSSTRSPTSGPLA